MPDIGRRQTIQLGLATSVVAFGPDRAQADPAVVKVALLAPFSGAWARQGELMKSGAVMAIDDINGAGGIKVLGGAKMQLLTFDAGDSTEKAKNAAQRMVAQAPELVGGTGAWLSSFTLGVTEVTERAQLPWLTESYSDAITSRGFRYVFQTSMTAEAQAQQVLPLITELGKAAGVTVARLGIVADNTASTVSFLRPMREKELSDRGIKLMFDETYTPPLSDATSLVQRVRSSRPQIMILGASNVGDTKLLLDKLNEFGLARGRLPLLGTGGAMAASEMLNLVGRDQLEGLMVVVANWGGKNNTELVSRYVALSKEPWMGQDAIQTYFDMMLLKEAVERAGAADKQKVADALHSMDLNDGPALLLSGRRVKFDAAGHVADADMVVVQWQAGIPQVVYPAAKATASALWPKAF